MNITFKRANLLKKLALVNGNIKQKNLLPIHDYCHVSFNDDGMILKSANNKHILEVVCKYESIEGELEPFICDTMTIFKVLSNLKAEDVYISLEQKEGENQKTIVFGAVNLKKKYEVGTYYQASDYPVMPEEQKKHLFNMSGDLFYESISKGTVFNLEGDISVPAFAGVGIEISSDSIKVQSTNKISVLSQQKIAMETQIKEGSEMIVIDKGIMDSIEVFKQATELSVYSSKTSVFISDGINKLSSRLVEGKWPAGFNQMMEKFTNRPTVKFDREELLMTLKRISVMSGSEHAIAFEFTPFNKESCVLSSAFIEFNKKASEEISCTIPEEYDIVVKMNCMFLMQILSNLSGNNIFMSIDTTKTNHTSEIRDDSDGPRRVIHLITGMRV